MPWIVVAVVNQWPCVVHADMPTGIVVAPVIRLVVSIVVGSVVVVVIRLVILGSNCRAVVVRVFAVVVVSPVTSA